MPKVAEPQRSVREARKDYECQGAACSRLIRRGDHYTQLSYPPHFSPYASSPVWTIHRLCGSCEALPADLQTAPLCGYRTNEGLACTAPQGHAARNPPTPHEFPSALF